MTRPMLAKSKAKLPVTGRRCAHCERRCDNFAGGFARVNSKPLCHPNATGRPDCYHLVSVYGHTMPCATVTCYEDGLEKRQYEKG